jgi:hypothetical protein
MARQPSRHVRATCGAERVLALAAAESVLFTPTVGRSTLITVLQFTEIPYYLALSPSAWSPLAYADSTRQVLGSTLEHCDSLWLPFPSHVKAQSIVSVHVNCSQVLLR